MTEFFVEAEVDDIFAGEPEEHVEYPIGLSIEGDSWATSTVNGRISFNGKKVVYTEDEVRELLGVAKPKDEMRYFHVHLFTKDVNDDIRHISLSVTSKGMFSRKELLARLENDLNGIFSYMDIISWQELSKEDYEAFTS